MEGDRQRARPAEPGTRAATPEVDYIGMLPCFFGGRVSRFESVLRSAMARFARVCAGSMMSVIMPLRAA